MYEYYHDLVEVFEMSPSDAVHVQSDELDNIWSPLAEIDTSQDAAWAGLIPVQATPGITLFTGFSGKVNSVNVLTWV